ncbi:MAG: hypothetical protein GY842_08570 [bacterium]|nr:hypothetical protein [bacterium]
MMRTLVILLACASTSLAEPWSFVAVGDSRGSNNGVNTAILSELAVEIAGSGAEFVMFPGDLVNGYTNQATLQSQLTTWRNTIQPVYDAGIDVYAVRGNHDVGSPAGTTAWNNVFSGSYAMPGNGPAGEQNLTYSVTHRNTLILGLDQYTPPHRVNQPWLDAQLAANESPHVFAFGHEPAFRVDHSDCLDDYPTDRNAFWSSLEGAGARAYFAGHDHFYDHARVDGDGDPSNDIHQYVVGTAGAPLRNWSPPYSGNNSGMTVQQVYHAKQYGYVLGEIDGLDATLTWMQRTGAGTYTPRDTWTYTAIPEPATAWLLALATAVALRRRPGQLVEGDYRPALRPFPSEG